MKQLLKSKALSVLLGVSVAWFGLGVAGCTSSGGGGGGSGGGGGLALQDFPVEYAKALCVFMDRCAGQIQLAEDNIHNYEICIATIGKTYQNTQFANLLNLIQAGVTRYNPAQARECVGAIKNASCEDRAWYEQICAGVFEGTMGKGEECVMDEVCADPQLNHCQFAGECPGVCTPRVLLGKDCSGAYDLCEFGTICVDDTCVTEPGEGDPCGAGVECAGELFCVGASEGADTPDGECKSLDDLYIRGELATCDISKNYFCREGLRCEFNREPVSDTEGICMRLEQTDSAVCQSSFPDPCASGYYCQVTTPGKAGQCVEIPLYTQACPEGRCTWPSVCVDGFCLLQVDNGQNCGGKNSVCYSNTCVNDTCVAPDPCAGY